MKTYNGELSLSSLTATQIVQMCACLLAIVPGVIILRTLEPKLEQQMSSKGLPFITMLLNRGVTKKPAIIELCLLPLVPDYCPTGGYFRSPALMLRAKQSPSSVSKSVKIVVKMGVGVNGSVYSARNVFWMFLQDGAQLGVFRKGRDVMRGTLVAACFQRGTSYI